jgi:hypothetical protein
MGRFIVKHINDMKPQFPEVAKNNIEENKSVMTTDEKIAMAQSVLSGANAAPVKRVKKDKGLIERTESSKTILTEDNKELLND